MVSRAPRCACGGRLAPGETECASCKAKRVGAGATIARDDKAEGDTAPQDSVDIAAGGRARSNTVFGRQCEPYTNSWEAAAQQVAMRATVPNLVATTIGGPASDDLANIWRRYINGVGGLESHDGVTSAGDRIANAFKADERHAPAEDAVLDWVRSRLRAVVLPKLAGVPSVTLTFDELGVPGNLRKPVPDYDNNAFTVAANLAGGIGSSDFGVDSRDLGGSLSFEKVVDPTNRMWCSIRVRGEFEWVIRDGIDFCPGNAGNTLQEAVTIPMSRLEATGLAKDVGLFVRFRRVRNGLSTESFRNPDIDG